MFNRTTSFIFSKYGEVFRSMPDESSFMKNAHVSNVRLRDKQIHYYMNYDRPVYIRALSGVIMLIVAPKSDPLILFLFHRMPVMKFVIQIPANTKRLPFPADSRSFMNDWFRRSMCRKSSHAIIRYEIQIISSPVKSTITSSLLTLTTVL